MKKNYITVPANVQLKIIEKRNFIILCISGNLGFSMLRLENTFLSLKKNNLAVTGPSAFVSSISKLVYNTRKGLTNGFKSYLEVVGIGFKFVLENEYLKLDLGFSHTILFQKPNNLQFTVHKNRFLKIYGTDLNHVNQTASRIKLFKTPDIYKGKGIRYRKELLTLKQGKKKKK